MEQDKKKQLNKSSQNLKPEEKNRLPFCFKDEKVEDFLLTGEHSGELEDFFGPEEYSEIQKLAREARSRSVRGGPRVFILPGIMGSKLGRMRQLWFDDVLWFDPVDIAGGNLTNLSLEIGAKGIQPLGVLLLAYLKLKLRLRVAGFDASFYAYDWRQSLDYLGEKLKRYLMSFKEPVFLVAHSMGGLVSRAALASPSLDSKKVPRLIMLGTPNSGSFVPVQAMRGVYSLVRKVAALDLAHTSEELADRVFNSFPGLYQMLPFGDAWNALNLYDTRSWPVQGPKIRSKLLQEAKQIQSKLAAPDDRFFLIAGIDQETVTGLRKDGENFVYDYSTAGDGTVPLEFARLPGVPTYYINESHGSLPNNRIVAEATADILSNGSTERLPSEYRPGRAIVIRSRSEEELRIEHFEGRRSNELSNRELRHLLEEIASPIAQDLPTEIDEVPAEGFDHKFQNIVVGRRVQHRIDIRLAHSDITQADADAYVLGIFRNVAPDGAARAIDDRLDGAVTQFTSRRMFSGNVGEIFNMPAGRQMVYANHILFVGLGHFDRISPEVQRLVSENVMRTVLLSKVEEFATVLFGTGSGMPVTETIHNMLKGFLRALLDSDEDHRFRCITICELDENRYADMKQEIYRLASTPLFNNIEVIITEVEPRDRFGLLPVRDARVPLPVIGPTPAYLIVRQHSVASNIVIMQSAILGTDGKATVPTFEKEVSVQALNAHLKIIESNKFSFKALKGFGKKLADLIVDNSIQEALHANRGHPLVVVHDAPSSRIPWETLCIHETFPTAETGLSRQYMAENMSIAKWLEERRMDPVLNVLLIVNPTGDLPGAVDEGKRIKELLDANPSCRLELLESDQAAKRTLEEHFQSGKYEVVHYCGHAFFDEIRPEKSGIHCSDGILRGEKLASMGNLPSLVFFNACESGRVRRRSSQISIRLNFEKRLKETTGLAEAFLRGGVANYIGTYWPVGDYPAKAFADKFYSSIMNGKSVGEALQQGRHAVLAQKSVDWADYIHYGDRNFRLKQLT